jgi:hypothetical protein
LPSTYCYILNICLQAVLLLHILQLITDTDTLSGCSFAQRKENIHLLQQGNGRYNDSSSQQRQARRQFIGDEKNSDRVLNGLQRSDKCRINGRYMFNAIGKKDRSQANTTV